MYSLTIYRFLYRLYLAQDANFRLSNRAGKGDPNDPPLQPGSAYMIDPAVVNDYVKDFIDQKEVCAPDRKILICTDIVLADSDMCGLHGHSLIQPQALTRTDHDRRRCLGLSTQALAAAMRGQPAEG
jgi:hypothetical protein